MARKKKEDLEKEAVAKEIEVTTDMSSGGSTVVDETAGMERVDPTPRKPPRKSKPETTPPEEPAPVAPRVSVRKKFLVTRGGRILHRGAMVMMRTGKEIKEGGYNIKQLKQQGIGLEEVKG